MSFFDYIHFPARLALLVFVCASGCTEEDTRVIPHVAATQPETLNWDLSTERNKRVIAWPDDVTGDKWFIESPKTLNLVLPKAQRFEFSFRSAIISGKGDQIRSIYLFFEPESSTQCLARALELCALVHIDDVAPLHKWADNPRIDLGNAQGETWIGVFSPKGSRPVFTVEIRPTFNWKIPWQVRLGIKVDE